MTNIPMDILNTSIQTKITMVTLHMGVLYKYERMIRRSGTIKQSDLRRKNNGFNSEK